MIWPLSLLASWRSPTRGTIEAIYGAIVAQARAPAFYREFGVPDTVDGRFDMVVLHLWLLLRQRDRIAGGWAQELIERFCSDMDHNLRELGVGDLTVPKRMVKFGEALYGRAQAYDAALAADAASDALAHALNRNIYGGSSGENAFRLAAYVRAADDALAEEAATRVLAGQIVFPQPIAA